MYVCMCETEGQRKRCSIYLYSMFCMFTCVPALMCSVCCMCLSGDLLTGLSQFHRKLYNVDYFEVGSFDLSKSMLCSEQANAMVL